MAIKEGSKLNEIVPSKTVGAIIPASFDDAVRFGRLFVGAGLYSVAKKGRQENKSDEEIAEELHAAEAQAAVLILYGMELGIPPLQALSGMALINGKPCIYGDLVPAILWSNGFSLDEKVTGDGETLHAVVTVTRPDGKTITREYSAKDAIEAGLWDRRDKIKRKVWKNGSQVWDDVPNDAPWYRQRKRMVQMRARGFACRDGASDVLRGMYLKEEIDVDLDRSEWSEAPTAPAPVELPSFEVKPAAAPAAIEDHTARNASEEVAMPTFDTKEAVEQRLTEAEPTKQAAHVEPEKRGRGRPRKEVQAQGTVRAPVPEVAPVRPEEKAEATPEEIVNLVKAKFAAATSMAELDDYAEEAQEMVLGLGRKYQTEVQNAFDARADALETLAA